jgi:hypothetical protein
MKSQVRKTLALLAMLISLVFIVTNVAAKKGGNNPPPTEDLVYTATAVDPDLDIRGDLVIEPIDSHGVNKLQIVFRHTEMDLAELTDGNLFYDRDGSCTLERPSGQGIMVLRPETKKVPSIARLEYWFEGQLKSHDVVTYLLVMEGELDPDNWPPTEYPTTLPFNYWELAAENKWAQRQDCAGDSGDGSAPWEVTVERQPSE